MMRKRCPKWSQKSIKKRIKNSTLKNTRFKPKKNEPKRANGPLRPARGGCEWWILGFHNPGGGVFWGGGDTQYYQGAILDHPAMAGGISCPSNHFTGSAQVSKQPASVKAKE